MASHLTTEEQWEREQAWEQEQMEIQEQMKRLGCNPQKCRACRSHGDGYCRRFNIPV